MKAHALFHLIAILAISSTTYAAYTVSYRLTGLRTASIYIPTTSLHSHNERKKLIEAVYQNRFSLAPYKWHTLIKATKLFEQVPGFSYQLEKLLKAHDRQHWKGIFYEIEKAVELAEKYEEQKSSDIIIAFNPHIEIHGMRREFDIVTSKQLIECKNVRWNSAKRSVIQKQLLEQHRIARALTAAGHYPFTYSIFSKRPLPPSWKKWCARYRLPVIVD